MTEIFHLTGGVEIQAAAGDQKRPPRVSILAYAGGLMTVPDWGPVILDLSQLDISGAITLLADHENKLRQVVGTGTATVRSGQLFIDGTLTSATEAGRMVLGLHADKVPLQASVGVAPGQQSWLSEGETIHVNGRDLVVPAGGAALIESGKLRETSLTPLGSDSETRVDIAAAQKQRKQAMPTTPTFDEYLQANNHDPSTITTDMKLALQATYDATHGTGGVDADRIMTIAGSFPPDVISSDRGRALQAAATRGTINASGFQAGLVQIDRDFARADLMVADRPVGPAIHSSSRDTSPDMLCAAFSRSAGLVNMESHFRPEVLEAADRAYPGGVSLGEVLLQAAGEAGYHGRQALRAGNLGEVLRAAFSTHSITTMLTTTGNKMLLDGFNTTEQVWRVISQIKPVKDFKTITSYRLTASLEYELVPPAGEIPHGTLGQDTYTNKADTYAKMLALTRTDIVNDDLGAFDDLRNKLGVGGGRKLNQVFWSTFLSNMATVFTTGRGNLQEGAATALAADGDALQAAEQLFLDMLAPNAEIDDVSPAAEVHPLGIEPAVMLMPTAVGTIGRKLYVSQEIRDTTANTTTATDNLWKNRFKPAVSAYLGSRNTNGSDTGWFLCADPANLPTMQVLFLDGQQSPIVESSDANFSTLGIEMRGYYDFGVSPAEWRASVMSDGTD